jgi:DNA polymerase III alpha subunit
LLAGIVTDFRVINGQRGKLALFKLDDKSGVIEARADEALINANRKNLLKDDELIVVMGKLQPDRFPAACSSPSTRSGTWSRRDAASANSCAWRSMAMPRMWRAWCGSSRRVGKLPSRANCCGACRCA